MLWVQAPAPPKTKKERNKQKTKKQKNADKEDHWATHTWKIQSYCVQGSESHLGNLQSERKPNTEGGRKTLVLDYPSPHILRVLLSKGWAFLRTGSLGHLGSFTIGPYRMDWDTRERTLVARGLIKDFDKFSSFHTRGPTQKKGLAEMFPALTVSYM
jgi:hypothetical protein